MGLFTESEILGIADETLSFVLSASQESHPNEYMGFLRATNATRFDLDRSGRVITDVLVIPGTQTDTASASVDKNMQPNAVNSVGSVHSHPSGVIRPSDADLQTFSSGDVHIIVGAPYGRTDWKAFDNQGTTRELDVLDVELRDEEFFDITQAEIDRELAGESDESDETESGWFRSLFR